MRDLRSALRGPAPRRLAILLAVIVLLTAAGAGRAWAEESPDSIPVGPSRIELGRRYLGFGGLGFRAGDGKRHGVYRALGFTVSQEFETALAANPEALRECRKAVPFRVVGMAGAAAYWLGSLLAGLDLANHQPSTVGGVTNLGYGDLHEEYGYILLGGMIVWFLASRLGDSPIYRGVQIHNESVGEQARLDPPAPARFLAVPVRVRSDGGASIRVDVLSLRW